MPTKLSQVKLDEVSLVDSGANQRARVVLFKRNTEDGDACKGKGCKDIEKAPAGIQFVIGFKEEGGSEIQSVVFDSAKWDAEKARAWLKEHDMEGGKVDETANMLRFRQADPGDFKRFRTIQPGKQISKALRSRDSWSRTQTAVERAVRQKFEPKQDPTRPGVAGYLWVRDFFEDSVVFELNGELSRVGYEIDYDDAGEIRVTVGNAVPVELVYQDVKKAVVPDGTAVPETLHLRAAGLRASLLVQKMNTCHSSATGQFCSTGGGGGGSTSGSPAKTPTKMQNSEFRSFAERVGRARNADRAKEDALRAQGKYEEANSIYDRNVETIRGLLREADVTPRAFDAHMKILAREANVRAPNVKMERMFPNWPK